MSKKKEKQETLKIDKTETFKELRSILRDRPMLIDWFISEVQTVFDYAASARDKLEALKFLATILDLQPKRIGLEIVRKPNKVFEYRWKVDDIASTDLEKIRPWIERMDTLQGTTTFQNMSNEQLKEHILKQTNIVSAGDLRVDEMNLHMPAPVGRPLGSKNMLPPVHVYHPERKPRKPIDKFKGKRIPPKKYIPEYISGRRKPRPEAPLLINQEFQIMNDKDDDDTKK